LDAFAGYTSLEIIFEGEVDPPVPTPLNTQTQVTCLKLDLNTAISFDMGAYLIQSLQELHIKHRGSTTLLSPATPIRLPNLKVLGLTPTDTGFAQLIELPTLQTVILYGLKHVGDSFPSLAQFADIPSVQTIIKLELRDWVPPEDPPMPMWSIVTSLGEIIQKIRSVESLKCIDSFIQGARLVELITTLKRPPNMVSSKLEHIVIDCCTGITRDQCDAIGQMVEKLEVCV
jgi:hypothetical protein